MAKETKIDSAVDEAKLNGLYKEYRKFLPFAEKRLARYAGLPENIKHLVDECRTRPEMAELLNEKTIFYQCGALLKAIGMVLKENTLPDADVQVLRKYETSLSMINKDLKSTLNSMFPICNRLAQASLERSRYKSHHHDDIYQDDFENPIADKMVVLAEMPENPDKENNFTHLYLRSLKNAMIDVGRRARVRNKSTVTFTGLAGPHKDFKDELMPEMAVSTAIAELRPELSNAVVNTLRPLSATYIQVFLNRMQGMSYEDICTHHHLSLGTVKTALHRVHTTLKKIGPFKEDIEELSPEQKRELLNAIQHGLNELLDKKLPSTGMFM